MNLKPIQIVVSKSIDGEMISDKFPVGILDEYEDHKWEPITDYWTKNYSKFIR